MRILINKQYGGFTLSEEVKKLYIEKTGNDTADFDDKEIRHDEELIKIVEEIGLKNSAGNEESIITKLSFVEIPDDSYYLIEDYDGIETLYYSKTPIYEVE